MRYRTNEGAQAKDPKEERMDDDDQRDPPTPTEEEEVRWGVEENKLLDIDASGFINIISTRVAAIYWRPRFCEKCSKPRVTHSAQALATCPGLKLTQHQRARYERACKENGIMNMAAAELAKRRRASQTAEQQTVEIQDNRTELSSWDKDESWETYKMVLQMYDKVSEKTPEGKFNDLITALKKSGRTDLTEPLMEEMMSDANRCDIINISIKWLATRCGRTPTEKFITTWREYRTGLRGETETIADYVNRFQDITRRLSAHGVQLDKRVKAIAMIEMARLTTAECVAVLSIAKFEENSDNDDLDLRMRDAMRTIAGNILGRQAAITPANAVLAAENVKIENSKIDQVPWIKDKKFGGNREPYTPNQTIPGGQTPQPKQQKQLNANQQGWAQRRHPPGNQNQHQSHYKIWYEDAEGQFTQPGEDEGHNDGEKPEQVWYSGQEQENHIIIDTGSKYCVMGVNTKEVLYKKMKSAGCEPPKVKQSDKLFRFGGNTNVHKAKEAMFFELNLNGKPTPVIVHVVPTSLPFIVGKKWLRDSGVQLDLGNQRMRINGAWMKTVDMGSGHEGIAWNEATHTTENSVYLGNKVSRKEWTDPEVMEAMAREIKNLEDMGTFMVVRDNPRYRKLDSTWVITRKEAPDGKGMGAVKARLCVRGDQERDDHTVKTDSPTVDRATVKILFAIAATNKWKVKTVDVTAAFLQGKKMERDVFVRPPAEYRTEGEVWQLLKGLYGLKEASMLWFKEVTAFFKTNNCKGLTGDLAAFVCHQDGRLVGLVVIHVDDITLTGTEAWLDSITKELRMRFKISKEVIGDFVYTGINVVQDADGTIRLDQGHYVDGLEDIPKDTEKNMTPEEKRTLIKKAAGKLQYLNLSRPDLVFNVSMLSRAVKDEDLNGQIDKCRSLASRAKQTKYVIKYGYLGEMRDLELHVYSDAAYGNQDLDRVKSTAGIIIFLRGPYGSAPVLWKSRAIRRVCKSVKTAETLALEEAVDAAINLSRQIHQMITGKKEEKGITIRAYTDSKSLVDSVQSCKQVIEGSMRQVVEKLKEHVLDGHVAEITWVRGARNWADGLTKKTVDMVDLIRILETGQL